MLDLGKLKQDLYKIKLDDGTILKIKKPTQAMLLTMVEFRNADEKEDIELLGDLYALMLRIFNRNTNDIEFSMEDMQEMFALETALIVLKDYMDFSFKQLGE